MKRSLYDKSKIQRNAQHVAFQIRFSGSVGIKVLVQRALERLHDRRIDLKIWGNTVTMADFGVRGVIVVPETAEHPGRVFCPGLPFLLNSGCVIR